MISFTEIKDERSLNVILECFAGLDDEQTEELAMMLESFLALAAEVDGVGATESCGCLLVRICDGGEYMFPYPFAITRAADERRALTEISRYARRELLPIRLTDVPREGIELLCDIFPHVDARVYEDDDDTFAAIVLNELDSADSLPRLTRDGLVIEPLADTDAADYARLCSDRVLNKFWGFDDLADNPTADPEQFMITAERELRDGVALSLAVRREGKYLGEAVIYDFDYLGGAEIGIRILSEYHGERIGSRVLEMLIDYCRAIRLSTLRARVMAENIPAIKMTARYMKAAGELDGITHFTLAL